MEVVASDNQPPAFTSQYFVIQNVQYDSKLTCIKQRHDFRDHFHSVPGQAANNGFDCTFCKFCQYLVYPDVPFGPLRVNMTIVTLLKDTFFECRQAAQFTIKTVACAVCWPGDLCSKCFKLSSRFT